jgi:ATP-dependent Lhr-like helicase
VRRPDGSGPAPLQQTGHSFVEEDPATEEEGKEIRRMFKNASLVREHGKRAMIALAGRGIGPDTAARVLSSFYEDEDEFLRDILSAELTYARTKRIWD